MHVRVSYFAVALAGSAAAWKYNADSATNSSLLSPTLSYTTASVTTSTDSLSATGSILYTAATDSLPLPTAPSATKTLTTYTTVTTCPVTMTTSIGSSYIVETKLTTSTIVVTSCKGGCYKPTLSGSVYSPTGTVVTTGSGGSYTYQPSNPVTVTITGAVPSTTTITSVGTTTVPTVITTFIPQSTPIGTSGTHTYYSTSLAVSYITTKATLTTTEVQVICPAPTAQPTPVSTPTPLMPINPPNCSPAPTVYSTITVTEPASCPTSGSASGPDSPKGPVPYPDNNPSISGAPGVPGNSNGCSICQTYTSILSDGSKATIVISATTPGSDATPTGNPGDISTTSSIPQGTGSSGYPHPTGTGFYPITSATGTASGPRATGEIKYQRYAGSHLRAVSQPEEEKSRSWWSLF